MPLPQSTSSQVERVSLRDIAAARITGAILDGTLEPGEHLRDTELQEWLGVSRTPIREALIDLERAGLVEMSAQRYTRVATPNEGEATEALQTLGVLLGGVIRITTPVLTKGQRTEAARSIDAIAKAADAEHAQDHATLAWKFWQTIIDECPNPVLVRATRAQIEGLTYRLSLTRSTRTTDWDALRTLYPSLKAAIVDNDPVAAELAAESLFLLP
jgi:DNA-binding GntR family transcriptional regulator